MPSSSWLIGSHASIPATTVTVVANGNSEDLAFPAGSYYLHDPTTGKSALSTLAALIATHADITTCTGALCEDRIVRVTANVAFTASFDDDTLRELLGLTANWTSGATTQAAQGVSGYLFCPGKLAMQMGRFGTQGFRVYDTAVGMSGPGSVTATQHNYHTINEFEWKHVANSRVWPADEGAGSWVAFHRNVLRKFFKINLYEGLTNDEGSTATVDLNSVTRQGPYIMRPSRGDVKEGYKRSFETVYNYLDDVEIKVVSTSDYA